MDYDPIDIKDDKPKLYTEEKKEHPNMVVPPDEMETITVDDGSGLLSKKEIILLCISYFGLSVAFLMLSVELVPAQIQSMVGELSKGRWLGGMVAGGAVVTLIAGPLIGMKSDRCNSPYGKRRPVMVMALLTACLGMCGMAFSAPEILIKRTVNETGECNINLTERRCMPYMNNSQPSWEHVELEENSKSISVSTPRSSKSRKKIEFINELETSGNLALYIVCFLVVTTSFICITIPYNGLVSDKSNPRQRGLISGIMGFFILTGNICGAAIALFFTQMGILSAYGCILTLLILCVLTTVFTIKEDTTKTIHEPITWRMVFIGFWEPLKEHDFRWVFVTRFFVQQGLGTITGFLDYWMSDMLYLPYCWAPERGVGMFLLPVMCTAAVASLVMGSFSDRIGRRKPLIIAASLLMSSIALVFAFMRGETGFYVVISLAFVFGIGLGTYQAVDFALVLDVLPNDENRSRDLAVWHQAMEIPKALATPIAGILLDVFERINCEIGLGYIIIFVVTSVYYFLSALFMYKIRGIK